MRTGLIGKKVGMSRYFYDDGRSVAVTLVHIDCRVIGHKTPERDGYTSVQVGFGEVKPTRLTKPLKGVYEKSGQKPAQKVCEFRVNDLEAHTLGSALAPSHFKTGQHVDVQGYTIGKGFAGPMKRWNFAGLRASHGVSLAHRSHGSTGQCQDPGKVFKNKKMAGRLGNEKVTVQTLEIIASDDDKGLLLVKGALPGAKGSFVKISDAIKKAS